MNGGRLLRIILIILIIGMGGFLIVRNINLKKQLKDGQITEIKPRDFLPFSGNGTGEGIRDIINNITGNDTADENDNSNKNKITKIKESVAGMIFISIPDEIAGPVGVDKNGDNIYEYTESIRYVVKENGYVYDYLPKYKKSYLISDTAIPKISYAHFSTDGNTILFQYLDENLSTEKSILGTLGDNNVVILPDNIISFSFGKNGEFVYVIKDTVGAKFVLREKSGKETIVYTSPISEWNVSFLGENNLLVTTKASEYAGGYAYTVDIKTKKVTKLWSNINGLTTKTSFNGNYILKSETVSSGPELSLYEVKTGIMSKLDKMGLVEKCNFSQDETILTCGIPVEFSSNPYPDDWYLGIIKTNDILVRYTTQNKNSRMISNLSTEINKEIDILETISNNSGNKTAFIDKSNMDLYLYEE